MTYKTVEACPQAYARIGGLLYLIIIVCGAFAEGFVTNSLVAPGDAATTAHNIMAAPAPPAISSSCCVPCHYSGLNICCCGR
jgi:hypothetical protein